jgi:hypothetical protein
MYACMHAWMEGWMYGHFLAFFTALNVEGCYFGKKEILGCVLAINFGLIPLLIGYRFPN